MQVSELLKSEITHPLEIKMEKGLRSNPTEQPSSDEQEEMTAKRLRLSTHFFQSFYNLNQVCSKSDINPTDSPHAFLRQIGSTFPLNWVP